MSQTETGKAVAAEERTEAAKSFVRTVKAATRRTYTPEEKIRIVLEGFRREVTVSDLCRREGIKPHSSYSWTKEFMEAGKERLTRDSVRDVTRQEVHQLKRENGELKQGGSLVGVPAPVSADEWRREGRGADQGGFPGSRLHSVGSQGNAGVELPAVGRMDHRQHGLLRIGVYGLPHPSEGGSGEEA